MFLEKEVIKMANTPIRPKSCIVCGESATRYCNQCWDYISQKGILLCNSCKCPNPTCVQQRIQYQQRQETERKRQKAINDQRAWKNTKIAQRHCDICGRDNADVNICIECHNAFCNLCGQQYVGYAVFCLDADCNIDEKAKKICLENGLNEDDFEIWSEPCEWKSIRVSCYDGYYWKQIPSKYVICIDVMTCELCKEKLEQKRKEQEKPKGFWQRLFS